MSVACAILGAVSWRSKEGQHLIRVKTRLQHGEFLPWLDAEFGWKRITAYNFMKVADAFSNVQNLNIYQPSALYALANGLAKDWIGRVFMNPPYAQPLMSNFAEKLVSEIPS